MADVEYELVARVDNVVVYRQTSQLLEVVEQSLGSAAKAVQCDLEQKIETLKPHE